MKLHFGYGNLVDTKLLREKGPNTELIACLAVGVRKARKIAGTYALPIVGVHHMEAHALVAR